MRLPGSQPRRRFRLSYLIPIVLLAALVLGSIQYRQQTAAERAAQARASAAETQLAQADASITALVQQQAAASATVIASGEDPGLAVQRALTLAFTAYKDPTAAHVEALSSAFGPPALAVIQPEAEHLISAGTHLGGNSAFTVKITKTTHPSTTSAAVTTDETWTYDELNGSGQSARCVVEQSTQTYTLSQKETGWMVQSIQLGTSDRHPC